MKMIICILITMFMTSLSVVNAQAENEIDVKLENISGKYAECTAYYELIYQGAELSNNSKLANAYKSLRDETMVTSLLLANQGRDQNTAVNVTNSRIEIYKKEMKNEINNRNENISILINQYHEGCTSLIENPPDEVGRVFEKANQK